MEFELVLTGDKELDEALGEILSEEGNKSINAVMRKVCREAVKEIVKPAVLALVPWDTGQLESKITVRAAKRGRGKIGFWVGFPDPLFQGDTFYGGFIEFGWDHRLGVRVEADSYLRQALYPNEQKILDRVRQRVKEWVDLNNRLA